MFNVMFLFFVFALFDNIRLDLVKDLINRHAKVSTWNTRFFFYYGNFNWKMVVIIGEKSDLFN